MKISFTNLSTKDLVALSQCIITISDEPVFAVVKYNPFLAALKTVDNYYDALFAVS
jgi:hypothetical protein